jgi:hypothetical protein
VKFDRKIKRFPIWISNVFLGVSKVLPNLSKGNFAEIWKREKRD